MGLLGKTGSECCDKREANEFQLGVPILRKMKINADGLIDIRFD
jgi:hypothetical protein